MKTRTHDPRKIQLCIYLERGRDFVLTTAVLSLLLWLIPLWTVYKLQSVSALWDATVAGWQGTSNTNWLLMRFAFALALAVALCIQLLLAIWWKRSGEHHHRGAHLEER